MKMVYVASLALIGTLGFAADALAHGGGYRHYRGPPPGALAEPPPPPCICASVDCTRCSHEELRSGSRLAKRDQETEVLREWPDLRQVRVTHTFRAKESGLIEAFASIAPGRAFGVTAASIEQSDTLLVAALRNSEEARREYIVTRRKKLDPLLLTRRTSGEYDLRAFPVRRDGDTVVVVEGLALASKTCGRTRIYREGDLHLAVVRLAEDGERGAAALVDVKRGRALHFMTGREARARFGQRARQAEEVPGIAALERSVKGDDDRVWVALEKKKEKDGERAPRLPGGVPPESRVPNDPPPPPTPVDPAVTAPVRE